MSRHQFHTRPAEAWLGRGGDGNRLPTTAWWLLVRIGHRALYASTPWWRLRTSRIPSEEQVLDMLMAALHGEAKS